MVFRFKKGRKGFAAEFATGTPGPRASIKPD